eukprot:9533685-Heterocapsa_arctica.AAC.1
MPSACIASPQPATTALSVYMALDVVDLHAIRLCPRYMSMANLSMIIGYPCFTPALIALQCLTISKPFSRSPTVVMEVPFSPVASASRAIAKAASSAAFPCPKAR